MGTDIHAAIEYRESTTHPWMAAIWPNKWHGKYSDEPATTPQFRLDRDYSMFAILAGVRNGQGFAGCDLGDGFTPISQPKGVPDDISEEAAGVLSNEHTPTWISLREILEYDWTQATEMRGVVSAAEFEEWERLKEWHPAPKSYSGDVMGGGAKKVSVEEMRATVAATVKRAGGDWRSALPLLADDPALRSTYARVSWRMSYAEEGSQILTKILPAMLKLGNEHGYENVRIVMDFDS